MQIICSALGGVLVLFLLASYPCSSLRCYQCNSRYDQYCYNLTMEKPHQTKVQICKQDETECLQKVGKYFEDTIRNFFTIPVLDRNEGEVVVFRHCSHKLFDSKCNDDQVRLA